MKPLFISSTGWAKRLLMLAVIILAGAVCPVSADSPGFFRYPDTDGKRIVFTSEGDLWTVPVGGGIAIRLTTHSGEERFAHYSPDGKWVAFSEQDDGHDDVYVMSSNGGEPMRLTFHPYRDQVLGWSDNNTILFRSSREIPYRGYRIYTVFREGGFPESIGLDKAALISMEPGGKRIAFNRYSREFRKWKRYKGGWAQDIWIGDLKKQQFENITNLPGVNDWDGTDAFPMWHTDGRIYFLSDRSGITNIFSMKPDGTGLRQHTSHDEFDVRWPSLGGGLIVYQNGMDIWAFDIASGSYKMVDVELPTDRIQARVKYADPKRYITGFELSPDGKRLLLCSRGELFTVPAKGEGLIRQLTYSSGIREKFPSWSPNGDEIIFWSDESSEEQLYRIPAIGGERTFIGKDERGWHYPAVWSPNGEWVAFSNEELELLVMNVNKGSVRTVDTGAWEIIEYSWSPDSRFLVYSCPTENENSIIKIWDNDKKDLHEITDDYFHSHSPVFDPEGKYLYFLSDRISNPKLDWHEVVYALDERTKPYLVVLSKDAASPFAPEADPEVEEDDWMGKWKKGKGEGKEEKDKDKDKDKEKPAEVKIDFEGLSERIEPFPVDPGNYFQLRAVKNKVFYLSVGNRGMLARRLFEDEDFGFELHRFNLKKDKHKVIASGIRGYDISRDGEKMVIRKDNVFTVQGVDEEQGGGKWGKPDEEENKNVDLSNWDLRVEVRAEWKQMLREAWRLQRDFFWDPNLHGVDWIAVYEKYGKLADRISTREELSDLIGEMFGELNCSHTYIWGGDQRYPAYHSTGLLGVDLSRDKSGFYRIKRIIEGRPWEEGLSSPLAAPGINAKEGNFIVEVNGRSVADVKNIHELFLNKADKIISLKLNSKPSLDDAREVFLKPLSQEYTLRYWDWVDGRMAYVDEKSDGKIGYIHLSDMGGFGLSQFAAAYKPQHRKPALIMDVRYNGGGFVAKMILSHLDRKLFTVGRPRHGAVYRGPSTAFYGYMAAVCNGETGSDGETFTEGFKRLGLGPVIGTRTWGGWVGIRGDKPLIDRGMITQPEFTGWGLDGEYLIEGWGTDPDMVVEENPAANIRGEDPQLDATIHYLMKKMKEEPKLLPEPPVPPDRSK